MQFEYPKGATPIDADEAQGLIPKNIIMQSELNEYEPANILEAGIWLFRKELPINTIVSSEFIKSRHKKCLVKYGDGQGSFARSIKILAVVGHKFPCN